MIVHSELRLWLIFMSVGAYVIGASAASAQPSVADSEIKPAAPPSAEHAAVVVETLVVPYVEVGMFDGVVLVGLGNSIIYEKAFGAANHERQVPNTLDSRFRVASISKGFTRAALGLLADRGLLSLDDPVSEYVPEIPRGNEITLQQMIDHRSGIVHINGLAWYEKASRLPMSQEELLARIAREPLAFEPGADRAYSNGAYAVLAVVIARVSGQEYGDFIRAEVCDPIGLVSTGHESSGESVNDLAVGHMPGRRYGQRVLAPHIDQGVKLGGGSIYSTARDLFKWIRIRRNGHFFKDRTAARLLPEPTETLYEDGRAPGYSAVLVHDPVSDITLIMLSNNYATLALNDVMMAALSNGTVPISPIAGCSRADATQFAQLIGRYQWPKPFGTQIELREEGGELVYVELFRPDQAVGLAATPDGAILCPLYNCILRPQFENGQVSGFAVESGWTSDRIVVSRIGDLGG